MKAFLVALLVSIAGVPAVFAQSPAGGQFQVNTYTTAYQYGPTIASDGSGNFVVVWASSGQDGDSSGLFGQRFNAAGVPQGPEFRVNTYTTGYQRFQAVTADANGDFVVVWQSEGATTAIFAQRYDAQGLHQGGEFRVNTYTTGGQIHPAVSSDPAGGFVVVWASAYQDGNQLGIFGQRFAASGVPQGAEFQVNTYTTGFQYTPAVAVAPSGNFLVVWTSGITAPQDGDATGIFGQCYAASGTPLGGEVRINTYTTGSQFSPRAAADGSGQFMVVWGSGGQDGSMSGVFGQRLDATCVPQGGEFRANTYTTARQDRPDVTADEHGNFTVVWHSTGDFTYSVFAQRFAADGTRLGTEFQVDSFSTGNQAAPNVTSSPDGDFIVAWSGNGPADPNGIYAQRYGDLIFEDGFESDSLVHWTSSSTDGADLKTSALSAMGGTLHGLRARVNDTNSLFVQDDTPNGENRYRARFYFDPNGFDPGEASAHFRTRLFLAQGGGFRLVTIVLKRQGGQYSVEARARANGGARIDTGFLDITDEPHLLEFDWQRATGPGAANGSLELWVDGASRAILAGLDNDAFGVDQGRLGALSLKGGANGTLFFDQFESRRVRYIGPE